MIQDLSVSFFIADNYGILYLFFPFLFPFVFFIFMFYFIFYCSTRVVPISPHWFLLPHPKPAPQSIPTLLSMTMGHLYVFLKQTFPLSPTNPLPPSPLVSVSLFLIFMPLVLFCLFVLFIRFLLQVRSYDICLAPPTYFIQDNTLQFHPCCPKGLEFLHSFCCVVLHCVNVPQFFY